MKSNLALRAAPIAALGVMAMNLAGCAAVKGIFKAGVWVGVLAAVVLIAVFAAISRAVAK